MRRIVAIAVVAGALLAASGCGSPATRPRSACLDGADAYLRALEDAPGEVSLAGETPISDCLAENQKGGDLATVGEAMVTAATRLNAEARARPGGAANLRLGYLLGAAERGAEGHRRHPHRAAPPPRRRRPLQPRQPAAAGGVLPGLSVRIRCRPEERLKETNA